MADVAKLIRAEVASLGLHFVRELGVFLRLHVAVGVKNQEQPMRLRNDPLADEAVEDRRVGLVGLARSASSLIAGAVGPAGRRPCSHAEVAWLIRCRGNSVRISSVE